MRIALGTAQFGLHYGIANELGQVNLAAAESMLHAAKQQGIDTLDTAIAYGNSEESLGRIGVKGFKVITKLPAMSNNIDDPGVWIRDHIHASLKRLGIDSVYGLLLHRPEQLSGNKGRKLDVALRQLKLDGLVKKVGISIYSPDELEQLIRDFSIDLVQAPFNLIDQRLSTSGWLRKLKSMGIEVHTRSAYLQGLLLMHREDIPAKFSAWNDLWDQWQQWLDDTQISNVRACISYPLAFKEIDRVVIGSDCLEQLKQTLQQAKSPIVMNDLPKLQCLDERLINPSNWETL